MKGMLEDLPKPIIAVIIIFALLLIAVFLALAGIGPFKGMLSANLPQELLKKFFLGGG